MNLDRYESRTDHNAAPFLAIYGNGGGRLSAAADRRWFGDVKEVVLLFDVDEAVLGVAPASDPDGSTYALSRKGGQRGGDIATAALLKDVFGVAPGDLDETHRLPLEWHDEHEAAVADVSPLLGVQDDASDEGDAAAGDEDLPDWIVQMRVSDALDTREKLERLLGHLTADGPVERPAAEIGAPIGLSGSRVAHNIRHLDAFVVERREPPTEAKPSLWYVAREEQDVSDAGDETEDEAATEADGGTAGTDVSADETVRVREAAQQCETLQDLADRLDVDVERARGLAVSASVYSELRDDVDRPGVDRDE